MKKIPLILLAVMITAGVASAAVAYSGFPDVRESDWFYPGVRYSAESELMTGYADGTFGPNDAVNRAQLATILQRAGAGSVQSMLAELQALRTSDTMALRGESWNEYFSQRMRFPIDGVQAPGEGGVSYEAVQSQLSVVASPSSFISILADADNDAGYFFIREESEMFGTVIYGPFYDVVDRIVQDSMAQ